METRRRLEDLSPRALLSEKQVETFFGLKAGTLRNWRVAHRGPRFLKVGRSVRYRVCEIERFLTNCTVDE